MYRNLFVSNIKYKVFLYNANVSECTSKKI